MPNSTTIYTTSTSNQEVSPQIMKQDDRFFSRLLSKNTSPSSSSMAAPSFRVYYSGETVNIPFLWESKPGIPKHYYNRINSGDHDDVVLDSTIIPPLTPPPSYHTTTMLTKKRGRSRSNFFINLLPKFMSKRARLSSSSSPSWRYSSPSSPPPPPSSSLWKSILTCCPSRIFRRSRSWNMRAILLDHHRMDIDEGIINTCVLG